MNTYKQETLNETRFDVKIGGVISGERLYTINTQEQFEKLFGSSYGAYRFNGDISNPLGTNNGGDVCKIPENTTIVINPIRGVVGQTAGAGIGAEGGTGDNWYNTYNGRPAYVLKNAIELSSNVTIIGFNVSDTIIIKNQDDLTNRANIKFYSYDATAMENVHMSGWSFDGRGGVNSLGGVVQASGVGGAFRLYNAKNFYLNLKIINHYCIVQGGAFEGGYNIVAEDIRSCYAGNGGGGSTVNGFKGNVYDCSANDGGAEKIPLFNRNSTATLAPPVVLS